MSTVENELSDVRKMLAEKDETITQLREAFFSAHKRGYARALRDCEVVIRSYGASKKVIQKVQELIEHGECPEDEAEIREPKNPEFPA